MSKVPQSKTSSDSEEICYLTSGSTQNRSNDILQTMRQILDEYYAPTEEEFVSLLKDALFVFDANALLNLYRYSRTTSDSFISILENKDVGERVWIPYQFALEYQRNRGNVIDEQKYSYQKIRSAIKKLSSEYPRHPYIDISSLMKAAQIEVSKKETEHPNWAKEDPIREKITEIFKKKIGNPYNKERMNEIYKDGLERFSKKTPPGYLDFQKPEDRRYGDLIGWFQIIDKAIETKKPIILISDELDEDWLWLTEHGRRLGARPELIREMQEKAQVKFHMYNSNNFIKFVSEYLKQVIPDSAVAEIEEIRKIRAEASEQVSATAPESTSGVGSTGTTQTNLGEVGTNSAINIK